MSEGTMCSILWDKLTNYVTSLNLASFFSKRSEMILIYSLDRSILPSAHEGFSRYFLGSMYQQKTYVGKVSHLFHKTPSSVLRS